MVLYYSTVDFRMLCIQFFETEFANMRVQAFGLQHVLGCAVSVRLRPQEVLAATDTNSTAIGYVFTGNHSISCAIFWSPLERGYTGHTASSCFCLWSKLLFQPLWYIVVHSLLSQGTYPITAVSSHTIMSKIAAIIKITDVSYFTSCLNGLH